MRKLIITILIILVALIIFLIIKSDKATDELAPQPVEDTGGTTGQFLKLSSDALVVMEQLPADSVIVSGASLSENGFIIVKKDEGGMPGGIIGISEFLPAGGYSQIDIGTTETLADGMKYYAEIFKDNGDGIFDPKGDSIVISKISGIKDPIRAEFMASRDAADPRGVQVNY